MFIRRCTGCQNPFTTDNANQTRCKNGCGRLRAGRHQIRGPRARDPHNTEFIGVDGEGVTRDDGTHDYVLLSVGDQSISDPVRLQWWQIFPFLYEQYEQHPDAAFVGFFLGYDFNQWLRTFPEERVRRLLTTEGKDSRERKTSKGTDRHDPHPVQCTAPDGVKWEFDILGMKRFKLKPVHRRGWLNVCDSGPFWQCSFLKAISPRQWRDKPVATPQQHHIITEGKAARATAQLDDDMIRYNITENAVLSNLTGRLNNGLLASGLTLKKDQWFGPGQAASVWLGKIKAPTREQITDSLAKANPDIKDVAWASYYGGWFETHAHGHLPGVTHEYDINSAYPAVIAELPCLLHGKWTSGADEPPTLDHTLVHARMLGCDPRTGVHSHRNPDGTILRPRLSRGWIWGAELRANWQAGLIEDFDIDVWHHYTPCSHPPPYAEIADLYQQRIAVGKDTAQGKGLKLVYNSGYGKLAQSIGKPRYAHPLYASLVTSGCRIRILDAIATHPTRTDSLVMVATDGVYFREPHPGLTIDPVTLGEWSHTTHDNLTLLMPGIYWDDTTRANLDEPMALKSRGVNTRDLARQIGALDDAFTRFDGTDWPTLDMTVTFTMTSCLQAIRRGKWDTAGHVTSGAIRHLSSAPDHKRNASTARLDDGVWRTDPWTTGKQQESSPYRDAHREALTDQRENTGVSPDGPDTETEWYWALQEGPPDFTG